jgi:branched-chain amino acid transport system permease protein
MRSYSRIAAFALVVVLLAALPALRLPAFYESFLYLVFFWIALATSWTILSGFTGYFSFGHGAFYGAGVYATATLISKFDMPFLWTLLGAGGVAALLGIAVGAVVFRVRRLRGELFALLTLAVTFVIATIVLNTRIDGGPGVFLIGAEMPKPYGGTASTIYLLGVFIAALSLAVAWAVQYSRFGRGLFAISDDEDVAEVMGVPTYRFKLVALGHSGFLAGVAGGIHAVFVTYVTVGETFSVTVPLFVVLMSVLGGARHWIGPAIGATAVTVLNYSFVGSAMAVVGKAIIGVVLVLAILFLPHGVMGFVASRRKRPVIASSSETQAAETHAAVTRVAKPAPKIGPAQTSTVLLKCEDVQLAFRGVRALAGVTLDVREGEILGLVGPNGSGKSTLVNAISGFYRPDAGKILFQGADLAQIEGHNIARLGVARTYQIPRPYQRLSVQENVALAAMYGSAILDSASALAEAKRCLDFVGLGSRASSLPSQLNLHQRKFLELARALACRPKLVLLDEVLPGLTPTEIESAVALIREIRAQGATVIFIEHNMRAVLELSDRLFVLNYGQVIASGLPRDVVRQPDVVAAYLGTEAGAAHA